MNNTKDTLSSVKDVIPEIGGNFQLDPAVHEKLPKGTKVLQASSYGTSLWTRTARVSTVQEDGQKKDYFLKCATEAGATMMEGEFHSMSEIYKLIPTFAPKPLAWGKFQTAATTDTYFFLCDFVEMSTELPDPVKFCSRIAQLHSMSVSPTGKFGFHVTNCKGKTPQPLEWEENWTKYFTRLISYGFAKDLISNGPWPEYEAAFARLVRDVIPQILDPLTAEGRTIKPCLIHGDLWDGNTTTNLETGEPMVFDAAACFAHNEYELGIWRREMVRFGKSYFKQYLRNFPPSEPVEQFEDRNALYVLKFDLDYCLHRPGLPLVREQILTDIMRLVEKYPAKDILSPSVALGADMSVNKMSDLRISSATTKS